MHTASSLRLLSGLSAMQLRVMPLLSGSIPVRKMPLYGLLRGQLLTARDSTTDSSAKASSLGVCTGSACQPTWAAYSGSFQNAMAWLRNWSGKT